MENDNKKIVKAKKRMDTPKPLIYMGPSVGNVLATNSVFSGGIPENVKGLFEKCPSIEKLFCEPEKINEYKKAITDKGSLINISYKRTLIFVTQKAFVV